MPTLRNSGSRAAHGQIVDRAMDRQRTDVAARKKSGFTTNESVVNARRTPSMSTMA